MTHCENCNGSGTCPTCQGTGFNPPDDFCDDCQGSSECNECDGTGKTPMTEQEAKKEEAIKDHQQRINDLKKAKKSAQSASVAVAYKTEIAQLKNEIAQLKIGMQP